jgi:hypothetical protein
MSTEDVTRAEEPVLIPPLKSKRSYQAEIQLYQHQADSAYLRVSDALRELQKATFIWQFSKTKERIAFETKHSHRVAMENSIIAAADRINQHRIAEEKLREAKAGTLPCFHIFIQTYHRKWRTLFLKKYYRKHCFHCDYFEDVK